MSHARRPFNLATCARSNILALQPYRCARDDYQDDGSNILLDASENAYGPGLDFARQGKLSNETANGILNSEYTADSLDMDFRQLNRYPDPHQYNLKQLLCNLRNTRTKTPNALKPENLFVGVGSDEAIRLAKVLLQACAQINDLEVVKVPLDAANGFALQPEAINRKLSSDPTIKVVYVCSPGNPTASMVSKSDLQKVLEHPTWNGIVVLDEAYIDFAPDGSSLAEWVVDWPNLVVLQTLSKAFGLAGIRVGAAFTSPEIAGLLNNLKAPYNILSTTSAIACTALQPKHLAVMRGNREKILRQRERMLAELPKVPGIGRFLGGTEANFLLVEVLDKPSGRGGKPNNEVALAVYEELAETKGVVVRFRGKEVGCLGCLRITVGTEEEVDRFLREIRSVLENVMDRGHEMDGKQAAEFRQKQANGIVA